MDKLGPEFHDPIRSIGTQPASNSIRGFKDERIPTGDPQALGRSQSGHACANDDDGPLS